MEINLSEITIARARRHLNDGDFTALELAEAYVKNIKRKNQEIFAYLEVYDDILEQARSADERIKKGERGSMLGIPIAIKDNMLVRRQTATAASKILAGHIAPYDATVIKKLREQGTVFLGRTNMDEFAMGSSTETSAYGLTKNPHDISRVPGGSSGGSAAAVAGDLAIAALGSDTGGSIRQPAAFCGTVGLKPTYGAVSRYGLMAMASSLDQIGPFTKTAEDAEILFDAIQGHDFMDSTSQPRSQFNKEKRGRIIGVPRDFVSSDGIEDKVLKNFEDSLSRLEKEGYKIVDIFLPNLAHSLAVYYILMPAEVSSNLARFDGIRYGFSADGDDIIDVYKKTRGNGFGAEVRRRIMLGTYVLSSGYYDAYYNKAVRMREIICNEFLYAFESVDFIATPATPSPAFRFNEKTADPLSMYLADIFTVPANIAGLPAISLPSGFVEESGKKLPLGFHLMAPHFREDILFQAGRDFGL